MTFAGWGGNPWTPQHACPLGPHRGPEGPCEDLAQCPQCGAPTWSMRPPGEVYGGHAPDCAAPERHEGHCPPGGEGHGEPVLVRGYFPEETG